jgi:transposase-like protein
MSKQNKALLLENKQLKEEIKALATEIQQLKQKMQILENIINQQQYLENQNTQKDIEIMQLKAQLNQNSKNSNKPPSNDTYKKPKNLRQKTGKPQGGQKGHKGHGLKITRQPDQTITLKPTTCKHCQTNLTQTNNNHTITNTRYKIDIQIQTSLTRYDQTQTVCPNCQTHNQAAFPQDITSTIQYGQGIKSISTLLTQYAMVSYDKTQKILNDIFDIPIATSTIVNHVSEFALKAEPLLQEIPSQLLGESVLNFDETGLYVEGGRQWLHTASSKGATYVTVHPKRGQLGIDGNGVLAGFGGVAVHDGWRAYFKYAGCVHALCNAHLLRELQGVVENTDQRWAGLMMDFLLRLRWVVDCYREFGFRGLPGCLFDEFLVEYDGILGVGLGENSLVVGVRRRSKARCLLDRFIMYRGEVCRFAVDFGVPFTNNLAERDIRLVKVKQKVSGGFRSVLGAENFGKIASIVGTAIKQKKSAYVTIAGILDGSVTSLFQKTLYD